VGSAFVLERNKPAVISEAFTILGDVVGTGVLHVEGKVVGNVRTDSVSISTTGRVEGAIECGSLQVKGQLHGACNCDELTVATGASVSGKLKYKSIAVSRGAKIEGDMNLPETVPQAAATEALPAPHGDPAGETSVQGPQSDFGETSNANVLSAETTHATTHA